LIILKIKNLLLKINCYENSSHSVLVFFTNAHVVCPGKARLDSITKQYKFNRSYRSFLLLIKIIIHAFIKQSIDKKYFVGAFGQFSDFSLFFPILNKVGNKLKPAKIIANIIYFIAIAPISIYLVTL
jgi:hypothetical protein